MNLDPWEGGGAGPGAAQRMSLDEIRQQQQDMITEQDHGLENLSRALKRQQEVGLAMQDEITEHNGDHYYLLTLYYSGQYCYMHFSCLLLAIFPIVQCS